MRVAQVPSCDGFAVESPDGCLGWVEETVLGDGRPQVLSIRTMDGRRALVPADDVLAVDLDTREVFVVRNPSLPAGPHVEQTVPGRPVWQFALFGLACLATLIVGEIALAFGIAYLVTGRLT